MKKALLFFAAFAFCNMLTAQYDFTISKVPAVGDQQYYVKCDTTGVTPGPGGAAQIWNFSGLTSASSLTVTYDDPANTSNGGTFTNANLAYTDSDNDYKYWWVDADSLVFLGDRSLLGTPVKFSNTAKHMIFPFQYQDSIYDDLGAQYSTGFGTAYKTGFLVTVFDGYGSLYTPVDTFTNVNRVKSFYYSKDSTFSGFPIVTETLVYLYEWYDSSENLPRLIIREQIINPNNSPSYDKQVRYADINTASEKAEIEEMFWNIYPVPASEELNIQYLGREMVEIEATLYSVVGKEVAKVQKQIVPGKRDIIPVHQLSEGIYFLKIVKGDQSFTKKIVIRH